MLYFCENFKNFFSAEFVGKEVFEVLANVQHLRCETDPLFWCQFFSSNCIMNKNRAHDRVVYYYDSEVGNFHYGPGHPMKPFRIHLTHDLVMNYNLYRSMSIYRPRLVTAKQMTSFHSEEYINFLSTISPDNWRQSKYQFNLEQFTLGPTSDCPIFDGLFEFCRRSVGGSIDGALRLCYGHCDTAINWSGGFHHAKKSESSGFCYVNDIVLAIVELLKFGNHQSNHRIAHHFIESVDSNFMELIIDSDSMRFYKICPESTVSQRTLT